MEREVVFKQKNVDYSKVEENLNEKVCQSDNLQDLKEKMIQCKEEATTTKTPYCEEIETLSKQQKT